MMNTYSYLAMEDELWEELGASKNTSYEEQLSRDERIHLAIERNIVLVESLLYKALRHDAILKALTEDTIVFHDDDDERFTKERLLPLLVQKQLREFVEEVAQRYNHVCFHSFEHASHVMMSATKMVTMLPQRNLSDIDPELSARYNDEKSRWTISDPWLHLSICLAALLHDVEHKGIPNQQLLHEQDYLSVEYGSSSCMSSFAECYSVDVGIWILESKPYKSLCEAIYTRSDIHFVISDLILNTDIASEARRNMCLSKWNLAYPKSNGNQNTKAIKYDESKYVAKAISDQIIQAADVSHTMQSFETFLKWNERLYYELLSAYRNGRTNPSNSTHPGKNWYVGQLAFYRNYVIPLAERLDSCGALYHPNGKNFTAFAKRNRDQWQKDGKEWTENLISSAEKLHLPQPMPPSIMSSLKVNLEMSLIKQIVGDSSIVEDSIQNFDGEQSLNETSTTTPEVSSITNYSDASGNHFNHEVSQNETKLTEMDDMVTTVDAVVPQILIKQILSSIETCTDPSKSLTADVIREAVSNYHKNGSIKKFRGALLFVDISGFTILSQTYPLEDFKTFINEYFTKIINLIQSFGGDVVKFAGDALFAVWTSKDAETCCSNTSEHTVSCNEYSLEIERCTACAIAISADCNNYNISKKYNRRMSNAPSTTDPTSRQNQVLRSIKGESVHFEERSAVLNVYCGVSEGYMAGIDVVARDRAEYFLIGQPLKG